MPASLVQQTNHLKIYRPQATGSTGLPENDVLKTLFDLSH